VVTDRMMLKRHELAAALRKAADRLDRPTVSQTTIEIQIEQALKRAHNPLPSPKDD
jgi:hypothetical protein